MTQVTEYNASQLSIIRTTVASDTNAQEFDLFMEAAKAYKLDPFRKQISAIVFNKSNPEKRKMAIIVGRDGLRAIAHRCGDYRPASKPAQYEYNPDLAGPANPKGIVSVSVTLSKQDNTGAWFDVMGEADWDEFAPVKAEWEYDPEKGKRAPTGKMAVDGNWAKSPKLMIAKCAEAQALRAGWPDTFGGLYSEEEFEAQTTSEASASEMIINAEKESRENLLGPKSILMTFDDTGALQRIPMGDIADRCAEFIEKSTPEEVHIWKVQNTHPLQDFWAQSPNDALEVKRLIEAKTASLSGGSE